MEVVEYTIFRVAEKKEDAQGSDWRVWWPYYSTTPADPTTSEHFTWMVVHKKSRLRWKAIPFKDRVVKVDQKLGKTARHSFAAVHCCTLCFKKRRIAIQFSHMEHHTIIDFAPCSTTYTSCERSSSEIRQLCLFIPSYRYELYPS